MLRATLRPRSCAFTHVHVHLGEQGEKLRQMTGTTVAHLHKRGGVMPTGEVASTKSYGTLASVIKQATVEAPRAGAGT